MLENQGWTESIARSVARSWDLDWRLDGLDGAAMEALIFCSRRFKPDRGVPFRGYARKRIHEASTEAARKSKGWYRRSSSESGTVYKARVIAADLYSLYPELRDGELPLTEHTGSADDDTRSALRNILVGAAFIAARQSTNSDLPDDILDYKRMIVAMAEIEPIHQELIWKIYWEGNSMRAVATEWETDELNVIREHKVLLEYMEKAMSKNAPKLSPKVRPGLKKIAMKLNKKKTPGPFSKLMNGR